MAIAKIRPKTTAKKTASQPAAVKQAKKPIAAKSAETSARAKQASPAKAEKRTPAKAGAMPDRAVPKKTGKPVSTRGKDSSSNANDRLNELRKNLLKQKEAILNEAKEEISKNVSGDNKQLVDTALDDGDWAQIDISEDISLQRLSAHRKVLHEIDEAIRKIAEGTYGVCEDCGEEISEKRLRVIPAATLCIDCQEKKEQFEALETPEL